jgi:pimeloyl-ACP methyl ester carboxylesterase
MIRRNFLSLAGLSATSSFLMQSATRSSNSRFAPVNGLQLLLRDSRERTASDSAAWRGFGQREVRPNLQELAKARQAIAVHLQGHGHTKDIDRPLRFEFMADDVAALIGYLKLGKTDVLGYSLGGGVALQTAIRHPGVNRLVVVSAAMERNGSFPEVNAAFDQMQANAPQIARNIQGSPLGRMYPEVNWEKLLRKIAEMESHDSTGLIKFGRLGLPCC